MTYSSGSATRPQGDTDQRLAPALVEEAFTLFLGRPPAPEMARGVRDMDQLLDALWSSEEFKARPQQRKNPTLPWPERQHFYDARHKLLYVPIGKNGCTFLKRTMLRLSQHPQARIIAHNVHAVADHVRTGLQLSDYEGPQVAEILSDPDLFSFGVLRDPARRLLSAYIEKFVQNRTAYANVTYHTGRVLRAVQGVGPKATPDAQRGITFRQFVTHVTDHDPATLDAHWRPQHLYLGDHDWTRLYRMDQMDALVADLQARTGVALETAPANRSGSGRGTEHDGAADLMPAQIDALPPIAARSFLTPDLMARIDTLYARDRALIAAIPDRDAP